MTLNEIFKIWLGNKKRQVKESTLANYYTIYNNMIAEEFGNDEVKGLSKKRIIPYLYKLIDNEKCGTLYCSDVLIVLKMLIRFAGDELDEDIPDTTWKVHWPTKNQQRSNGVERYSEDEAKLIVDTILAEPTAERLGILLSMCAGMRIGEICALQWKDIDFHKKVIRVNKTLNRIYDMSNVAKKLPIKTKLAVSAPKTLSSNRMIPIAKNIYSVLKKFSSTCKSSYYVCSGSDVPLEDRMLRRRYKEFITERLGMEHFIKFHGLRHTFATTLIENKVDVKTVSTLLGHADITTTLDVYVHPSDESKADAVNAGLKKIFR